MERVTIMRGMMSTLPVAGSTFNDVITVDFYAAIMGFPDWYVFSGTKTEQYEQVGNAVCYPIAREIWNAIKTGESARMKIETL
jgi:DNA (cytosine-5)-methyltransferase 1